MQWDSKIRIEIEETAAKSRSQTKSKTSAAESAQATDSAGPPQPPHPRGNKPAAPPANSSQSIAVPLLDRLFPADKMTLALAALYGVEADTGVHSTPGDSPPSSTTDKSDQHDAADDTPPAAPADVPVGALHVLHDNDVDWARIIAANLDQIDSWVEWRALRNRRVLPAVGRVKVACAGVAAVQDWIMVRHPDRNVWCLASNCS
jgi:hypothetical protein